VAGRRLVVALLVAVALSISCSGNDPIVFTPAGFDEGLSAEYLSQAVHNLLLARFVLDVTLFNWDVLDQLDGSWHYDAAAATWAKKDSSYQSVTVGTPGGGSTQIRNESVAAIEVRFFDGVGAPQESLITAARATMMLRIRQRRYALDPGYELDESYDVTSTFTTTFGLDAGSADTLVAPGSIEGWWIRNEGRDPPRVDYTGTVGLEFDHPDHYVRCPAEMLTADIRLSADGVELDRFTGVFSAAADGDAYTGDLASERGPWIYRMDGNRSCPGPTAARTPPKPIEWSAAFAAR